jgi:hypothetical protein
MTKQIVLLTALCATVGTAVRAQDQNPTRPQDPTRPPEHYSTTHPPDQDVIRPPLFRAHETSLDLFGSLSIGQDTINNISGERVKDDGRLGAGIGVTYFMSYNLGVGVEAYTENTDKSFVDNTSANVYYRFPFPQAHLAPYVFGGAGHQFDPTDLWFAQVGAGLELRFTHLIGMFADIRYVFTDGARNIGVGRLGARFAF